MCWSEQSTCALQYIGRVCRRLRGFQYGFMCTDTIVKGSLHLNLQNRQLEYRWAAV